MGVVLKLSFVSFLMIPIFGCDAEFMGGGAGGQRFASSNNSRTPPGADAHGSNPLNGGFGQDKFDDILGGGDGLGNDGLNNNNSGNDDGLGNGDGTNGSGGGGPNGDLGISDDQLTVMLTDATLKVLRADGGSSKHNHRNISVRLFLPGRNKDTGVVFAGKKGNVARLPAVCSKSNTILFDLEIHDPNGNGLIVPQNQAYTPGPIGQRKSSNEIWVGYEREAISEGQFAYHNNDDWVVSIECDSPESKIAIRNLCIDDRIPGNDLVTDKISYSGDDGPNNGPARLCNGS